VTGSAGSADLERELARLRERVDELEAGETALRRYERLVSATSEGIALVDRSYVYKVVNDFYLKTSHRRRDEVVGRRVEEVFGKEVFRQVMKEKLDQCLAGETVRYRLWLDFKAVGRRFIEATLSPFRDHDGGEITGIIVNARDITDQEAIRSSLESSEQRFRTLADTVPVGVYFTDAEGRCLWANRRWLEAAGMSLDEALGAGWVRALHPDDRERVEASWERMVAAGTRWGLNYRFRTPRGRTTEICGLASPLLDPSGEIVGYVGANVDLSDLHRAKYVARESEAKYRALVEAQPHGFWMLDREGRLLEVNDAYVERSGYSRKELLAMCISDLDARESGEETSDHIHKVIRNGSDCFRTLHRAKDGTVWPVEVRTSYGSVGEGRFFCFLQDLSPSQSA